MLLSLSLGMYACNYTEQCAPPADEAAATAGDHEGAAPETGTGEAPEKEPGSKDAAGNFADSTSSTSNDCDGYSNWRSRG